MTPTSFRSRAAGAAAAALPRPTDDAVAKFAGTVHKLHRMNPADLAELRRMNLDELDTPVFWRTAMRHVPAEFRTSDREDRAWAAILCGMAHLAPEHYKPNVPLSRALVKANVSTERVMTLAYATTHENLPAQLIRICQLLKTQGVGFDWRPIVDMLRDPENARRQLSQLARDHAVEGDRPHEHARSQDYLTSGDPTAHEAAAIASEDETFGDGW
jgi:CRISPR type I-E-associated protein CasB/Cse2